MSTQSDESAATPSQADLLSLAGSVHTFESFGRAVVQAIIQASANQANQATQSAGVQATASVHHQQRRSPRPGANDRAEFLMIAKKSKRPRVRQCAGLERGFGAGLVCVR